MTANQFQQQYGGLQLIHPRGHDFEMEVPRSHLHDYLQNSFEAYTADLVVNLLASQRLFISVGIAKVSFLDE